MICSHALTQTSSIHATLGHAAPSVCTIELRTKASSRQFRLESALELLNILLLLMKDPSSTSLTPEYGPWFLVSIEETDSMVQVNLDHDHSATHGAHKTYK